MDASTQFIWIVGDPITQVKAPQVMNPRYALAGDRLCVLPASVHSDDLRRVFDAARRIGNLRGWIVTVPHKPTIAAWLDELSPAARLAGVVNAVRFRDGKAFGDLFDGVGFTAGLAARGFGIDGCAVLLLGAGGVGSAMALALAQAGASRVAIHDIDMARARSLVERLSGLSGTGTRFEASDASMTRGFDLIANASPVGMAGDPRTPIDTTLLEPSHTVAEVVMSPEWTPLLRAAQQKGCAIHPGSQVLAGQLDRLLDFFR
ncbi:shikimate dehydrogenase [Hydrogenophaga sp.]|uniref:shikimate dehydrogenase family protein n=1 Tax=Hydrogenophaga sp. TaxID=1904254 RepID=UPI00261C3E39|nr:shikimate dehydrogenase [Hydrogenophaga sp.]MCW5655508.1 shikimate dehydrogenase [Hydrogenophaga sp.]